MYMPWYVYNNKLYGGIVEPLEVKAACTWDKN